MLIRSMEEIRQLKKKPLDNLMGFTEYLQLVWPEGDAEGTINLRYVHWIFEEELIRAAIAARNHNNLYWLIDPEEWDNGLFFTIADALFDSRG